MAGSRKYVEYEVGRDAETGEFIPVEEAKRRKREAIVETIRRPVTRPGSGKGKRK